jgi:surface antigen
VGSPWLCRCGYNGRLAARLWRLPASLLALSLVGGCSFQLDSLRSAKGDLDITGSVRPRTAAKLATEPLPPEGDLAVARAAVSEALSGAGTDTAVPWENPATGARGTITPIASAFSQDGLTCHDFLASFVRDGAESWMQGEACRRDQGKWEVRRLKPWQRT